MNKIDWGFWGIISIMAVYLIFLITITSGCAVLQPKPIPTIAPKPAVQLWQAAKASNWLATISIIGIGAGIFIAFKGKEWGMGLVISCCVILFMTLAVARFAWSMALCGLIGSVGILCAGILSRKRALAEIIKGVQGYRNTVDTRHIDTELNHQQSKSTQKLVKKIKSDLKAKGKIE